MTDLRIASKKLESAVREFAVALAEAAEHLPDSKTYNFAMTITKSEYKKTAEIAYRAAPSSYSSDGPRGASPEAVVHEMLRRAGWNEANKPMALLTASPASEEPIEQPVSGPLEKELDDEEGFMNFVEQTKKGIKDASE